MPNFTTTTSITTGRGDTLTATKSGQYEDVFNVRQECDNTNAFINIILGGSKSQGTLEDCKTLIIKNSSPVGAEIQIKTETWSQATPDTNGGLSYQTFLLAANDYMMFPNFRQINYGTTDGSAANSYQLTNQNPERDMSSPVLFIDSTADLDHATANTMGSDATHTTLNLEDGHSKFFKVGDLIRIENEICEVTAVGTGADLANSTCTIVRGLYGSTAATHADDVAIRLPFFNAYADFDKYSTAQTDASGRFKCFNFFGYGRTGDAVADGIVAGSISGKFYSAG